MPALARAQLESLLRDRHLDRTLLTAAPRGVDAAATGLAPLDARLEGGFPRGHLSEIIGPASAGRTAVLVRTLAEATRRGELVALVDALDTFDVDAGAAAGVVSERFLWVRGGVSPARRDERRALEQALKALALVLQAGNFGVVALDLAGAPPHELRRLPFTSWLRLHRIIEGTPTACLLVADDRLARSSAGLTVQLAARPRFGARLFDGLDTTLHVVNARVPGAGGPNHVCVAFPSLAD